jgi:uncharacterized protein
MRLCIASDTHRHRHELLQAVKSTQPLTAVLHAGDETSDAFWLKERIDWPVWGVAGNWDAPTDEFPMDRQFRQFGPSIYLVHGHHYSVKNGLQRLAARAGAIGAQIVIFGHTHTALTAVESGILYVNPGSLAQPRGRTERTYAILDIESAANGTGYEVRASHLTLQGETLADLMVRVKFPRR